MRDLFGKTKEQIEEILKSEHGKLIAILAIAVMKARPEMVKYNNFLDAMRTAFSANDQLDIFWEAI